MTGKRLNAKLRESAGFISLAVPIGDGNSVGVIAVYVVKRVALAAELMTSRHSHIVNLGSRCRVGKVLAAFGAGPILNVTVGTAGSLHWSVVG